MVREAIEYIQDYLNAPRYNELIVLLSSDINESKTIKKFPFLMRIDPPHSSTGHRHAHVSRMDNPSQKIAYNDTGTKHDSHKFCKQFPGLKNAQMMIRKEFNVPDNIVFEVIGEIDKNYLMIRLIESNQSDNKAVKKTKMLVEVEKVGLMKHSKEIELNADLRNKLQTAMTALELMKERKTASTKMIEIALKDLEKVLELIEGR